MFTPGIHSPNHVFSRSQSESESLDKESISSEQTLRFVMEHNPSLPFILVEAKEKRKNFTRSLSRYYGLITKEYLGSYIGINEVMREAESQVDCSWYWYCCGTEIMGCLILSGDCNKEYKNSLIHHVSVINPLYFGDLVKKTIEMLGALNYSRVEFRFTSNLHPNLANILRENQVKHLSSVTNIHQDNQIFEVYTGAKDSEIAKVTLTIAVTSDLTRENSRTNPGISREMTEVGDRLCVLLNFKEFLEKNENSLVIPFSSSSRLQQDLKDLLNLSESIPHLDIPPIEISTSIPTENSIDSCLSLTFRWRSCSFFSHTIHSNNYKYIRFTEVSMIEGSDHSVYFIPSASPEIFTFFITCPDIMKELQSELKLQNMDIFHKVENILRSSDKRRECKELWVPGFNKEVAWDMAWVHGLKLNINANEEKSVKRCTEKIKLNMAFPIQAKGLISSKITPISEEFIFGISHTSIDEFLEIPIFVCIIKPDDWITC